MSSRAPTWSLLAVPGLLFIIVGFGSALLLTVGQSLGDPVASDYTLLFRGLPARAFVTTFVASAGVTVVVLAMGYAYAYAMVVGPRPLRAYLIGFLVVQFATSSVARAYAWVQILQSHGVINQALMNWGIVDRPLKLMRNDFGMIVGTSHVLLPYMIIVLYAAMRQVDFAAVVAARTLGASASRAFLEVFLPATRIGVLSGSGLIFVLALSFYATPALLGDPSRLMISSLIMTQSMDYGAFGLGATLSIGLVAVTLAVLAATRLAVRAMNGRRRAGQ